MSTAVELSHGQFATLEALADTVVPGRKRWPTDRAVAGVDDTPGAVEAGAMAVLTHPAAGISDGVAAMADLLNEHARESAGDPLDCAPFVSLAYDARVALLQRLCAPETPSRELWFLVMLFAYMAYDSAPHLDTATAVRSGHPGLKAMGFLPPDADGLWRNREHGYGVATAEPRPGTDAQGNLP